MRSHVQGQCAVRGAFEFAAAFGGDGTERGGAARDAGGGEGEVGVVGEEEEGGEGGGWGGGFGGEVGGEEGGGREGEGGEEEEEE